MNIDWVPFYKNNDISNSDNNIHIAIHFNVFYIKNYNNKNLNICDFVSVIPIKTHRVLNNGKLVSTPYIESINSIVIYDSNFETINDFCMGITCISLLNCPKFKSVSKILNDNLEYFYIDGEKIDIIKN
jgi:hypothetical protein